MYILKMLSLKIQVFQMSFHLVVSYLISFINIFFFLFSVYRYFPSLIKLITKCFILLDAFVNGNFIFFFFFFFCKVGLAEGFSIFKNIFRKPTFSFVFLLFSYFLFCSFHCTSISTPWLIS